MLFFVRELGEQRSALQRQGVDAEIVQRVCLGAGCELYGGAVERGDVFCKVSASGRRREAMSARQGKQHGLVSAIGELLSDFSGQVLAFLVSLWVLCGWAVSGRAGGAGRRARTVGPGARAGGRVVHVHDVWADVVGGGVGEGEHARLRRHRRWRENDFGPPRIRKSVCIRS
jgi:hypothetical protein